jgi:hypothetical protein
MKKFAVIIMCALAVLVLVSASPAPAPSPVVVAAPAVAAAGLGIIDFEGKIETNSWKGGSSSIAVAVSTEKFHSGAQSLKVEAAQKDYCGLAIVLPAGKTDWTGYSALKFWTLGTASGASYNVYLEEAKGEQFLLGTVKDDVAGWKEVIFAFADAKSRSDYQAATATVDKVLQMQLLTLQMAPNPGSMTFFVDDISLAK